MARIVNSALRGTTSVLTEGERRKAERRLQRRSKKNPLRRIRISCCAEWRRDPSAVTGDHIWCDVHGDFARVVDVAE